MTQPLQLLTTADGSHTLMWPDGSVTYHSRHGAIQESMLVFMNNGFFPAAQALKPPELRVFEMGFGTGLNAFLTAHMAQLIHQKVTYHSIDTYPLPEAQRSLLNYGAFSEQYALWEAIGAAPWNKTHVVTPFFTLNKQSADLLSWPLEEQYHLIYFDAFAPEINPELWTEAVFAKLFAHTAPAGMLVTYCSKSRVRKAMEAAGWKVEKLPGPPGKREIVRARKAQ